MTLFSNRAATTFHPVVIDGILYSLIRPGDEEQVLELAARDACATEPLRKSLKLTRDEAVRSMRPSVRRAVQDGVSLKASDVETGAVVGYRLAQVVSMDSFEEHIRRFEATVRHEVPRRLQPLLRFIAIISPCKAPNVFRKYGVDRYVEFCGVNVDTNYRNRKIAQRMLAFCYDLYRELGLYVVKVHASNERTIHVFRKQGFDELASYRVCEFMHEGKPYFSGYDGPEYAVTFAKDLRKDDRNEDDQVIEQRLSHNLQHGLIIGNGKNIHNMAKEPKTVTFKNPGLVKTSGPGGHHQHLFANVAGFGHDLSGSTSASRCR